MVTGRIIVADMFGFPVIGPAYLADDMHGSNLGGNGGPAAISTSKVTGADAPD